MKAIKYIVKHFIDRKTSRDIVVEATMKGWCFTLPSGYTCYRNNECSVKENLEEGIKRLMETRDVKEVLK